MAVIYLKHFSIPEFAVFQSSTLRTPSNQMFTYEFRFLKVSFLLFGLASFRTDRSSDASDANNIWATAWAGICIAYSLDSIKSTKNFVAYASTFQIL